MKRSTAFILLLSILLSSLLSCTFTTDTADSVSSNITLTSSNTKVFGEWLTDRLGDTVPNVILGIGDSNDYDIDMSDFEDDGYIIKSIGGGTAIFGKTADGLDLACRRFANDHDMYGEAADTVYHEGYRIDEMRLFGMPLSEYTIAYPDEYNDNMLYAVQELRRLIESACGVSLPVTKSSEATDSRAIRFTFTEDDSFGEDGFRYYEDGGDLVFECAYERGATNAVYAFLENECGWYGLRFGNSDLEECDLIDLSAGVDKTAIPAFEYMSCDGEFKTDRGSPTLAQMSFGPIFSAMQIWDNDITDSNFCYTDEEDFAESVSALTDFIETKVNSGAVPGESLRMIGITGIAASCLCESCEAVISEEGSTAGALIRFANKLSAEIGKTYPEICYNISLSSDMRIPPKTAPAENVYITYSLEGRCLNHTLTETRDASGNMSLTDHLEGWLTLTDNVCVSLNGTDSPLRIQNVFDNTYEDIRYLSDIGVKAIRLPDANEGYGTRYVENILCNLLNWDISMTEEEFDEHLYRILEKEYGDGWQYILQYADLWNTVTANDECADRTSRLYYDTKLFAECFEDSVYLTERAAELACNAEQQKKCELLFSHTALEGCFSSYYSVYYSADKERIALLDKRYSLALDILEESGIDTASLPDDLHDAAWHHWTDLHDELYTGELPDYTNTDEIMEFSEAVNEHTADDRLTFGFRTDTHYVCEVSDAEKARLTFNYEAILRINRYIDLDFIAHGGDIINGDQSSAELALQSLREITSFMRGYHHATPHIFLRGNHDDNSWYGYKQNGGNKYYSFPADTVLTTDQWRECVFSENTEGFVTDDSGAYGYFDHEESKIRVLLLDTSDLPYVANEDGIYKYGSYTGLAIRQDQLQFMADAMTFADKGSDASEWAILVISHVPPETMRMPTSKYRFGGLEAIGRNNYAFLRLLKAYQRGTVFNETQNKATNYGDGGYYNESANWFDDSELFSYSVYADYSVNGPGEVIGFICGHTHIDNFSDEVGKVSYSWNNKIYPELSYGYPYFSIGTGGIAVFTVERNGDGTGTVYVDRFGKSTVAREDLIADGDNAVATKDKTAAGAITSVPDTGSIASGNYSVNYSQNR